jgi:Uncharacterised protein family (UPF0236)
MERSTTREEFCQAVCEEAGRFAEQMWNRLVVHGTTRDADTWVREHGGVVLRAMLGQALTARAEALGGESRCRCGGRVQFRQRRSCRVHTVLPGRDVDVRAVYAQCATCHRGHWPVLEEVGVDAEGFTVSLQELGTLAAVLEPYESASEELLRRFAGVVVSAEKLQALVREEGARGDALLQQEPADAGATPLSQPMAPIYVAIDGGMIFVDGRWQEVKLGCVFGAEQRLDDAKRPALVARQVVAVRGTPDELAARLWPRAVAVGAAERPIIVLGDGAPWIWNVAAGMFPRRIEILDWYHADEHVSATARALYGEGTPKAAEWRTVQLDRLWNDGVDQVIDALRFLGAHQRSAAKRTAVEDLSRYLTTNRARMRYATFRAQGYHIGSGAVESAVSYVVQQRMKRVGMRWRAAGADAMLALRSIYRSTGVWDEFWAVRRAA